MAVERRASERPVLETPLCLLLCQETEIASTMVLGRIGGQEVVERTDPSSEIKSSA